MDKQSWQQNLEPPDIDIPHWMRVMFYRPGLQETVQHTVGTQVNIPYVQMLYAIRMRAAGYIGVILWIIGLIVLTSWVAVPPEPEILYWILLVVLMAAIPIALASYKPRRLFIERMEREITNPYGDHPTTEMFKSLKELLETSPVSQPIVVKDPIPVRVPNVGRQAPAAQAYEMPDDPEEPVVVDLAFQDLVAFAERAVQRGLTRSSWIEPHKPRVRLPSGTRVTRGVYDKMIENLRKWHMVVTTPDGSTDWVSPPEEIIAFLHDTMRQVREPEPKPPADLEEFAPGLEELWGD